MRNIKKPKPRIRISTLSRAFVCSGLGVTGSGWTMRDAFHSWEENRLLKAVFEGRGHS